MKEDFVAAKYDNRIWAVYDKVSRTFSHIGMGKRTCEKKAEELNKYMKDYGKKTGKAGCDERA